MYWFLAVLTCVQWFSAGMFRFGSRSAALTSRQSTLDEGRVPTIRIARVSAAQPGVVQKRRQSAASLTSSFLGPGGSSEAGAGSPVIAHSFQSSGPLPVSTIVAAG